MKSGQERDDDQNIGVESADGYKTKRNYEELSNDDLASEQQSKPAKQRLMDPNCDPSLHESNINDKLDNEEEEDDENLIEEGEIDVGDYEDDDEEEDDEEEDLEDDELGDEQEEDEADEDQAANLDNENIDDLHDHTASDYEDDNHTNNEAKRFSFSDLNEDS